MQEHRTAPQRTCRRPLTAAAAAATLQASHIPKAFPCKPAAAAMSGSGPKLRFCPESNDLLYPKEDKERKVLVYFCRRCVRGHTRVGRAEEWRQEGVQCSTLQYHTQCSNATRWCAVPGNRHRLLPLPPHLLCGRAPASLPLPRAAAHTRRMPTHPTGACTAMRCTTPAERSRWCCRCVAIPAACS